MLSPTGWRVAAASVRGKSHEESGDVCQDSHYVESSSDGTWLAVAVSDGAGTAASSDESSRLACLSFARFLIAQVPKLQRHGAGDWLIDAILHHVLDFRESLRQKCGSEDIRKFNCTLLVALLGPDRGISVHIGDGALFGGAASQKNPETVDFSGDFSISNPENGEYANETFFITEMNWVKHLRVVSLGKVDWLVVGTDGGMALALDSKNVPKTGFVPPVFEQLLGAKSDFARDQRLVEILSDRQADRVTSDDKTLVFAFRNCITRFEGDFARTPVTPSPAPEPPRDPPAGGSAPQPCPEPKWPGASPVRPADRRRRWLAFLMLALGSVCGWQYSQSGQPIPLFFRDFHFINKFSAGPPEAPPRSAGRPSHVAGGAEKVSDTTDAKAAPQISSPAGNQNAQVSSPTTQDSAREPPNTNSASFDMSRSAKERFLGPHIAISGTTERPNINATTFDMSSSAKERPWACHIAISDPTLGSLTKDVAYPEASNHGPSQASQPSAESIDD